MLVQGFRWLHTIAQNLHVFGIRLFPKRCLYSTPLLELWMIKSIYIYILLKVAAQQAVDINFWNQVKITDGKPQIKVLNEEKIKEMYNYQSWRTITAPSMCLLFLVSVPSKFCCVPCLTWLLPQSSSKPKNLCWSSRSSSSCISGWPVVSWKSSILS